MKVKIKKLSDGALMPRKQTEGAVAYDLYTPKDYLVLPGRNVLPLDISLEFDKGWEFKIEPRSGFSAKGMEGYPITAVKEAGTKRYNADVIVGKGDSDYRGNYGVIIYNRDAAFRIPAGTRIAQGTFYQTPNVELEWADDLSDTERGDGGYGHTGSN